MARLKWVAGKAYESWLLVLPLIGVLYEFWGGLGELPVTGKRP